MKKPALHKEKSKKSKPPKGGGGKIGKNSITLYFICLGGEGLIFSYFSY